MRHGQRRSVARLPDFCTGWSLRYQAVRSSTLLRSIASSSVPPTHVVGAKRFYTAPPGGRTADTAASTQRRSLPSSTPRLRHSHQVREGQRDVPWSLDGRHRNGGPATQESRGRHSHATGPSPPRSNLDSGARGSNPIGSSTARAVPATPTVGAAAAFHAFLRKQNGAFVGGAQAVMELSDGEPHPSLSPHDMHHLSTNGNDTEAHSPAASSRSAPHPEPEAVYRDNGSSGGGSDYRNDALAEWTLVPDATAAPAASSQPRKELSSSTSQGRQRKSGRPQQPQQPQEQLQRRRRELIVRAQQHTANGLADRHRAAHQSAFLHAYRLLKSIEHELSQWAQQRRHPGRQSQRGSSPSGAPAHPRDDLNAVDARFYECAGQIQRTLHRLTPRHFDAMRGHRVPPPQRRSSANRREEGRESLPSAPPPLLLLSLLWRLLHITQLFYSIGRHASLPRSAVQTYVQSSNCAYGIREVLRVLAGELALTAAGCGPQADAAATPAADFLALSRDELFQVFYAVLCLPSEEAPGVPLYDPRSPATDERSMRHFQEDCVATSSPATARMPLEEWCVRWWCHVFATVHLPEHAEDGAARVQTTSEHRLVMGQAFDVIRACLYATHSTSPVAASANTRDTRRSQAVPVTPFMYFETPPRGRGGAVSAVRQRKHRGSSDTTAGDNDTVTPSSSLASDVAAGRRYRPHLVGALGGDRTSLRIPYHLGQRFVQVFLGALLAAASAEADSADNASGEASARHLYSSATSTASASQTVAVAMQRLMSREDRDAVRDIALLCSAILYFEVFSPSTAAFMAQAASLCREQVELLTGHEISCVLLAYATLQRWERGGRSSSSSSSTAATSSARATPSARWGDDESWAGVQSASAAAQQPSASRDSSKSSNPQSANGNARGHRSKQQAPASSATETRCRRAEDHEKSDGPRSFDTAEGDEARHSTPSSDPEAARWQLFFITLGSRAGQLGDTLSEEDVTRVLRAMELVGLEHGDLRRALESSLRMRQLNRRMLYET